MAEIKHARGVNLLIKVARPETPTVFETFCTINAERGITFTAGVNEQEVIDCADLEAVAWVLREKTNLSAAINGGGTVNTPDIDIFYEWLTDSNSWPTKTILDVPGSDGGVVFTGNMHLTEFSVTGNKGEKMQASTALSSDGVITKTANT
nr:phage tail tube protein [uncultured Brevundimonas sp.]